MNGPRIVAKPLTVLNSKKYINDFQIFNFFIILQYSKCFDDDKGDITVNFILDAVLSSASTRNFGSTCKDISLDNWTS